MPHGTAALDRSGPGWIGLWVTSRPGVVNWTTFCKMMTPDSAKVLTIAALRAAAALQLRDDELARSIGVGKHKIALLRIGQELIPVGSDAGQRCQLLVRMYTALQRLVGRDLGKCILWMRSRNEVAGGIPAEVIGTNPLSYRDRNAHQPLPLP